MNACPAMTLIVSCVGVAAAQQPPIVGGELATVTPSGYAILYVSNRSGIPQIYRIDVDGSHEVQLTTAPGNKGRPFTSADGTELWYVASTRDTARIFALPAGGGTPREIGRVIGKMVAFSPDRRRIVYAVGDWSANKLVVANVDGTDAHTITDSTTIAWNTQWSPDGREIAFTGRQANGKLAVFVIGADGSARRQVTRIDPSHGQAQLPAWSPDGKYLAVQVSDTGRIGSNWIVDLRSGAARELNPHAPGYVDEIPGWFPDGRRLIYQSDRTGRVEVWVINVDGTGARQVTGRN